MTGRPPIPTRQRILKAAIKEFSRHGLGGGRVERVAREAKANLRMIYHYFGDKEGLYLASLEQVYLDLRTAERELDLRRLGPIEGIRRFVEYTFDHFLRHPEFIGMLVSENQLGARYLRRSRLVPELTPPLVTAIRDLLERGARVGVFRGDVDPIQFFVTLHALCYLHGSNRDTLSVMFGTDLANSAWLAARKRHVLEVVFGYLCQTAARPGRHPLWERQEANGAER